VTRPTAPKPKAPASKKKIPAASQSQRAPPAEAPEQQGGVLWFAYVLDQVRMFKDYVLENEAASEEEDFQGLPAAGEADRLYDRDYGDDVDDERYLPISPRTSSIRIKRFKVILIHSRSELGRGSVARAPS
jgi:hypothetical protein